MQKVVIIGGGIAGLTAAYYLSKNPEFDIELYEAEDNVGGRIQTTEIDGFKFNYGAFMILPWYKSFNNLLHDLGYSHHDTHLDGDHEYVWNEELQTFHEVNKHWAFDDVSVQTLVKALPDFITHQSELYCPDPRRFNMMTVEEYFKRLNPKDTKALDAINKIAVGYTYGAISKLPLSIYFGFAKEVMFNKGFKKVSVLKDGAHKVIDLLVDDLEKCGVKIITSSKVKIDGSKNVSLNGMKINYDHLILAAATDNLLNPFLQNTSETVSYNDHYVAYIKTKNITKVCGRADWNLVYTASITEDEPQLTCIGNFEATFSEHPERVLITYLRIPSSMTKYYTSEKAKNKIEELVLKFLPDAESVSIPFIHHWKNTMPIIGLDTLMELQQSQAKNNVYFAGDYMGAPSMEVAVQSGKSVADLILNTTQIHD